MPTLQEYYNTGNDGNSAVESVYWQAQTFTPASAHKIIKVKLLLQRGGSPGTLTVGIRATTSDLPTGSDLVSNAINGNTIAAAPGEWVEVTLGSGYDLVAGTQYAIVVRAPSGDVENYIYWAMDDTSPTYSGGLKCTSGNSGSSWSASSTVDMMFEEWGTSNTAVSSSVTLGFAPTVTRATTIARSASHALGFAPITIAAVNAYTYLCVASQTGGSIKTNDNGATWSVCAKTAAGAVDAAWFTQYDNRLCVLNYQNSGFSYSSINDIAANWTNKPNFPNLPMRFTGMFEGKDASDNPILYFLTQKGMYFLDVFSNFTFSPTEVTWEEDSTSGKKGLYWKGDNYVATGKGIYKISQGVVTNMGPDMDDGLPEDMQGTVTDMIGVGFWLVIAVDGGTGAKSSILKRYISGKHWHPVYVTSSTNSPIRTLCFDNGTLYFGEGTNVKSLPFPVITDNVNSLSTQTRVASGTLTYPYFHSIFETMPKVAHRVFATTENCTADENVTIHYRKDEETSWTSLGSFTTSPRPTALSFGTAGVKFERIQFRETYARGATTTNSPKVGRFVLEYEVIPPNLWAWTFKVMALTSKDQKGNTIIAALNAAQESDTLLTFYPDGDKSSTAYYVRVKGIPGGEKGTEMGQEGIYTVTVTEVVG